MNGAGRQGLRSGAAGVHHQRQYSDNFLDGSSNGNRWLQSAGLQHLQSSTNQLPPLQVISFSSPSLFSSAIDLLLDRCAQVFWSDFMRFVSPLECEQDYNLYGGGGVQGGRMYRNAQRSFNGGTEYYVEPSTPPGGYRASMQKKNGDDLSADFSPGLLDLHSFDTELLPPEVITVYSGWTFF